MELVCSNLETFFMHDSFSNVDETLIPFIENHLKELQKQTFSAVRGPNGFSRIRALAIATETARKEKRREEYVKQKDKDHSPIMNLQLDDEQEYYTEFPNFSRKNSSCSIMNTLNQKDDSIFEMEMEEFKVPSTPTKSSKTWRKISISESVASSNKSSPCVSPWLSATPQEK